MVVANCVVSLPILTTICFTILGLMTGVIDNSRYHSIVLYGMYSALFISPMAIFGLSVKNKTDTESYDGWITFFTIFLCFSLVVSLPELLNTDTGMTLISCGFIMAIVHWAVKENGVSENKVYITTCVAAFFMPFGIFFNEHNDELLSIRENLLLLFGSVMTYFIIGIVISRIKVNKVRVSNV